MLLFFTVYFASDFQGHLKVTSQQSRRFLVFGFMRVILGNGFLEKCPLFKVLKTKLIMKLAITMSKKCRWLQYKFHLKNKQFTKWYPLKFFTIATEHFNEQVHSLLKFGKNSTRKHHQCVECRYSVCSSQHILIPSSSYNTVFGSAALAL